MSSRSRTGRLVTTLALGLFSTSIAHADEIEIRRDVGCHGCLAAIPRPGDSPRPLLIALHGDEGSPDRVFAWWRPEAAKRGVILVAPPCPRDRGCKTGSFWQWDAPPDWLSEIVRSVAATTAVDARRIYVAGWSGGASYLARRAEEVPAEISAIALLGGGIPLRDGKSCGDCARPVFMLAGDRNPLHELAKTARDELTACHHDVRWDLLPGRAHDGELASLTKGEKTSEVLAWLLSHEATCSPRVAEGATPPAASSTSSEITSVTPAAAPSAPPPVPHAASASCAPSPRCSTGAPSPGTSVPLLAGLFAGVLRRIYRKR